MTSADARTTTPPPTGRTTAVMGLCFVAISGGGWLVAAEAGQLVNFLIWAFAAADGLATVLSVLCRSTPTS